MNQQRYHQADCIWNDVQAIAVRSRRAGMQCNWSAFASRHPRPDRIAKARLSRTAIMGCAIRIWDVMEEVGRRPIAIPLAVSSSLKVLASPPPAARLKANVAALLAQGGFRARSARGQRTALACGLQLLRFRHCGRIVCCSRRDLFYAAGGRSSQLLGGVLVPENTAQTA